MKIRLAESADRDAWDSYLAKRPGSTPWRLWGWREVIAGTYGHAPYYLLAQGPSGIEGVLPLFHMRSMFFGNTLVSMPFLDGGGPLAETEEAEAGLLREAVAIAGRAGASAVELRRLEPTSERHAPDANSSASARPGKVRMLLALPGSSDALAASFKAKLRSQIKRPTKEGCRSRMGGAEFLDDFYRVFLVNMRDLGSPVHSKKLFASVLREFRDNARIFLVTKDERPIAGSITISMGDTVANPWASSLRAFAAVSPNMLLYWSMLAFACDNGFRFFDFGRSSSDGGTYHFKEQWGAQPVPVYWNAIRLNPRKTESAPGSVKERFDAFTGYWKRMPVWLTSFVGPVIRRQISL